MRRDEHGSATLFAISCLSMLLVLGAALGLVGALVHRHRVAQSAADLAALAGAHAAASGDEACGSSAAVAAANGALLDTCARVGRDVVVEVVVAGPRWLGLEADLRAQARAGPGL